MKYIFCNGYFYEQISENANRYHRCELYLPSATGTYGEPIETTKQRWLEELNNGKRKRPRRALFSTGLINSSVYCFKASTGKMVAEKNHVESSAIVVQASPEETLTPKPCNHPTQQFEGLTERSTVHVQGGF